MTNALSKTPSATDQVSYFRTTNFTSCYTGWLWNRFTCGKGVIRHVKLIIYNVWNDSDDDSFSENMEFDRD